MKYNVYNPFLQSIRDLCRSVSTYHSSNAKFILEEMLKEMMHSMGMNMVREAAVRNFVERISKFSFSDEFVTLLVIRELFLRRERLVELRKAFLLS